MWEGRLHHIRTQQLRRLSLRGLSAPRLLPKPHPGWTSAVEAVHQDLAERMGQHHGTLPELWQRQVDSWLASQLEGVELRVRMRPVGFDGFIHEGRYTTQFERPGASGGAKHRAIRTLVEHTVLGVPPDCFPRDRPVYAYLSGSDESFGAGLQQYGPVVLHLKRSVLGRSTFVGADSLDFVVHGALTEPSLAPAPIARPSRNALPAHEFFAASHHPLTFGRVDVDPLERQGFADLTRYGYAEAQIHGGLHLDDVRQITLTLGTQVSAQVLQRLGVSGVALVSTQEAHP